jgi:xanthine dehydrogenase FAD-binding subunit
MDIAAMGCSVNVKLSEDKKAVADVRIAFGVAGPVPLRTPTPEAAARGKPVSMETAEIFGGAVPEDISPRTSWRATGEFRAHIAVEMAKRALIESVKLSGGEL